MTLQVWILVIFAMAFYTAGEYYSKQYAITGNFKFIAIGFLGYSINALLFFPALLKFNSLSVLGTIWNIGYVFITLFLGLVVFSETVSARQILGIILGFIAIILLS